MNTRARFLPFVICVVTLACADSFAQTPERHPTTPTPQTQEQTPSANSTDTMANEIGLLRRSLQSLNTRLREISEKLFTTGAASGVASDGKQNRLAQNLVLLSTAEQRAEVLRNQLLEMTVKETAFRNRLVQLEEDMRPESIDRNLSLVGTTRTTELRDARRRTLENERKGVENLLNITAQSRARLEDDVKQADAMVARLRLRLLPLIEKEIDSINPNPD
jgi:hypothetical protein